MWNTLYWMDVGRLGISHFLYLKDVIFPEVKSVTHEKATFRMDPRIACLAGGIHKLNKSTRAGNPTSYAG